MKKGFRAVALLLCAVFAAAFFAGCNLVEADDTPDLNQTVATVNGVTITLGEFQNLHDYYTQLYYFYGYDITSDEENYNEFKKNLLTSLVNEYVLRQKAEELGFTDLSEEDLAEVNESFLADYADYMESFREQAESDNLNDPSIDVDARMDELARAQLEENGQSYDETYYQYVMDRAIANLRQSIFDAVTITDDEVKAYYDEELKNQKEAIAEDPTAYEGFANGDAGVPALFAPEGYRYATHILVKFEGMDETIDNRIGEIEDRQAEIEDRLEEIESEISALDTAASDYQTKLSALNTEKDQLTAEKDALTAEYDGLVEQRKAACLQKATDIIAQLDAGKLWDELASRYNEDDGTKEDGPYFETGYLVGPKTTAYYQSFTDEAMTLTEIGQYSRVPVETGYGYHILMLKSIVTPGEVPYETVKDELYELVLNERQQEKWLATQEEWVAAADIVKYEDRVGIAN
ncbi:MAG: SurA N-terminal domain-containing protein [Christensenellales bacterium]|jgi:parvulin-like peptidyl-prolyl isomerase